MKRLANAIAFILITISDAACGQGGTAYTAIPSGYDYPAPADELLAALKANNQSKLRLHAWTVFAGLTRPARPGDPTSEAIWETWYSGEEVFVAEAGPKLQGVRQLQRRFTVPRQFVPPPGFAAPQAVGESELSFTLFNQDLRDHTRANKLQLLATLDSSNAAWPASAPVADRKIKDYPTKAMSLKLIWWLVKKSKLTPVPVWDEQQKIASAPSQPPESWRRVVAVDSTRSAIPNGEVRDVEFSGETFKGAKVVSIDDFYHFKLSKEQVLQANSSGALKGGTAEDGDSVVLVAMHYTTKEIPNWVWATFWWHDAPDAGRFAGDRPSDAILKGPWRHFLMDVSYDMDLPSDSDGSAHSAFNPYLEARFTNGVNSNCMTCHRGARYTHEVPAPPFTPVTRGTPRADDPRFVGATTVDFLWSLLFEGLK